MASQTSPIPSHLKTFCQNPPWRLSPPVYQKVGQTPSNLSYKKVELLPSDPEYQFVYAYFSDQPPTNRVIKRIFCIHHERRSAVFENAIPSMEDEAQKPVFQPKWPQEPQNPQRQQIIQRFQTAAAPFNPFQLWGKSYQHVTALPLWHGTSAQKCDSICSTGFTYFGKHAEGVSQSTDVGYFGSGIYFTNSARYASDIYGDGQYLLLAWVSMRQPYPITTDQPLPKQGSDMKKLQGKGAYENYNAHYIPVVPLNPNDSKCAVYYPYPSGHIPVLDELVVFQQQQTLIRFSVEMQVDLPHAIPVALKVEDLLTILLSLVGKQEIKQQTQLANILTSKVEGLLELSETQSLTPEEGKLYKLAKRLLPEGEKLNQTTVNLLLKLASPSSSPVPSSSNTHMPFQLSPSYHSPVISSVNDNSVGSYPFPNPATSPSYPPPMISNNNNPDPSYFMSNPVSSFSNMSISSPSNPISPPMTSYPVNPAPLNFNPPSPTLSQPSISIQPTVNAPSSLPSIAFGAAQWKQYFGDVGAEPPLPSNIQQILQSPCPFWSSFWNKKKVQETHLLVLVPTTVNGKPLTLKSLGELVKSPKQGNKTQYRDFDLGEYTDRPAPASHWVLMTRDVLPASRKQRYTDQQALVASYAQKTKTPYQVPNILDATVCIFLEYIRSGTRLYSDNPWTYTRCQEKYDADWQLLVGGFAAGGLAVGRDNYYYGVGALRKF